VTRISPHDVLAVVCELSGVPLSTLQSPTRVRPVSQVRAAAAHLLRTQCGLTPREVAPLLGRAAATVRDSSRSARRGLARGGTMAEFIERAWRDLHAADPELVVNSDFSFQASMGRSAAGISPRALPVPHLRDWRRRMGLGQVELARRAGVSRETISRMEHGRPAQLEVILRLAEAVRLPLSVLTASAELDALGSESDQTDERLGEAQARASVAGTEAAIGSRLPMPVPHLRYYRLHAGLSQPQLAQRSGMARETISRLENGRHTRPDVILRLADALLVTANDLTRRTEVDASTVETYRTCTTCGLLKPVRAFVRIRGTPYVYLRCRACRAQRARERYQNDPRERQRQIERARRNRAKRKQAVAEGRGSNRGTSRRPE
jgi:transcriptional regulator with XRE-family HTH domain